MHEVLTEQRDRVLTVTLNRPRSRNALNRALMRALWDAVAAAGDDPETDAVIVTGADPAFSAGIDLKEVTGQVAGQPTPKAPASQGESESQGGPFRDKNGLYRFLPVIDKPVIGAVNGVAVTGGLELALQCQFLVASERARFADTHARLGVMPGGGMTVLLAQSVGVRRAIEMSLTGNFLTAEQAYDLGLVNHVVPHEELLPTARKLAADIVSNDQQSVRELVRHYRKVANAATLDEAHLLEGILAETWTPGTSRVGERRAAVTERGRAQATGTP
jgi:enoyl-CoA hydratase/carnithine racemase